MKAGITERSASGTTGLTQGSGSGNEPSIRDDRPLSRVRAYLSLAGAVLAFFNTAGFMNAYGIFQAYYEIAALKSLSAFQISWIGSFATFLLFVGSAPAGYVADKYGPLLPMVLGSIVQLLGLFLLSLCKDGEYYQFFLTQGVLMALGMGFVMIPPLTIVATAFKKNQALAIGLTVTGSSLGGLIWPIVLNQLINVNRIGFPWAIRACGFLMLGTLVFACATVPLSAPSRSGQADDQSSLSGNHSDDETKNKAKTKGEVLKSLATILFLLSLAVVYLGVFSPFFYVSTYALSHGMSTVLSFYLVSVLNGASFFGRIFTGTAADRYGVFNLMIVVMSSSAVICFCWTAATDTVGVFIWAACYGFTSGGIMSLTGACAAQLSDPKTYGTVVGIAMAASSVTGLFGTPISGRLQDLSYLSLSVYAGATLLLGSLLISASRFRQSAKLLYKV